MLSQFTREIDSHVTLADLDYKFPKDVYPIGRLDADSEGLLILSNEKKLNHQLLNPKSKSKKTYWVQVEGDPTEEDLAPLENGIEIRVKGEIHQCLPAEVKLIPNPIELPARTPPIRVRKNVPDRWCEIKLIEGKNRQVRKMFAKIGFPVLRLVRIGLVDFKYGDKQLGFMKIGEIKKIMIRDNL